MVKANPEWSWGPLPDEGFFVERLYKPRLRVTYRRGQVEGLEWLDPEPSWALKGKYQAAAKLLMKRRLAPARGTAPKRPEPLGLGVTRTTSLREDEAELLDAWIARQEPKPSRSAAIRHFVLAGLRGEPETRNGA